MDAERVKKYTFVTANIEEPKSEDKQKRLVTRQGVYMGLLPNETIIIAGVDGTIYQCSPEVQVVDDKNLDPVVSQYVQSIRDLNR